MKSLELKPTHDNLYNTLLRDPVGRNAYLMRFVYFLNKINGNFSIAIDSRWGSGKTFFVKQAKMVLDAYNDAVRSSLTEDEKTQIDSRAKKSADFNNKDIEMQQHVSVYYDAWENDDAVDPLFSIIYEIMTSLNEDFSFKEAPSAFGVAASIFDMLKGKNTKAVVDALHSSDPLSAIRKQKDLHKLVDEFIETALAERGDRLVIFIDELDRCKPDYAVYLLERVKHYLTNEKVTIVFSVNCYALQHTIRKYYGAEFDATRYLDRFFDFPMSLPAIDKKRYLSYVGSYYADTVFNYIRFHIVETYHFEMREITRYFQLTSVLAEKPTHYTGFSFRNERAAAIIINLIVPIAAALRLTDTTKFDRFIQGNDSSPLTSFDPTLAISNFPKLVSNQSYSSRTAEEIWKDVSVQLYNALFLIQFDSTNGYETTVGNTHFSEDDRKMLDAILSSLSMYADYELFE